MNLKLQRFLLLGLALLFILGCSPMGDSGDARIFAASADPVEDLTAAAAALAAALIGIPAFLSSALTLLEYFGVVTEEMSDRILLYTNTGLYVAALAAVLTGQTSILLMIDYYLGGISPILVALLALISGGAFSVIQTKRYLLALRQLHPVQRAAIPLMV